MDRAIERALISVTDKREVVPFASRLAGLGVEIIASGGTARILREAGVHVTEISDVTGFPEIMDGRIKTLHPKIHGGILADRGKEDHLARARELGIGLVDLVAVNLYRFREAAGDPELGEEEIVESIDIGGPTLIRAAAKNYRSVTVVVDPEDYDRVLSWIEAGGLSLETRRELASKAFHHTASYDGAIAAWFERVTDGEGEPAEIFLAMRKDRTLRYGENPHLRAALYRTERPAASFGDFTQLGGKDLSFNNIQDMFAAFALARDLGADSCAIIKHMNPCGAASCRSPAESFLRARKTDPASAFGSVVAVNGAVDGGLARHCAEGFLEVLLARDFGADAMEILRKKKNLRLIRLGDEVWDSRETGWSLREAGDLFLLQERDTGFPELEGWKVATSRVPDPREERALRLSWKMAKHVKSNAIVICDELGTVGVGAGQMSRVDSCWIAVEKARREGLSIEGTSAGSDAFFPFPDGVETLAAAGVTAIIQPGGSIRDDEVVQAAEKLGLTMVMTGRRHFRH